MYDSCFRGVYLRGQLQKLGRRGHVRRRDRGDEYEYRVRAFGQPAARRRAEGQGHFAFGAEQRQRQLDRQLS